MPLRHEHSSTHIVVNIYGHWQEGQKVGILVSPYQLQEDPTLVQQHLLLLLLLFSIPFFNPPGFYVSPWFNCSSPSPPSPPPSHLLSRSFPLLLEVQPNRFQICNQDPSSLSHQQQQERKLKRWWSRTSGISTRCGEQKCDGNQYWQRNFFGSFDQQWWWWTRNGLKCFRYCSRTSFHWSALYHNCVVSFVEQVKNWVQN